MEAAPRTRAATPLRPDRLPMRCVQGLAISSGTLTSASGCRPRSTSESHRGDRTVTRVDRIRAISDATRQAQNAPVEPALWAARKRHPANPGLQHGVEPFEQLGDRRVEPSPRRSRAAVAAVGGTGPLRQRGPRPRGWRGALAPPLVVAPDEQTGGRRLLRGPRSREVVDAPSVDTHLSTTHAGSSTPTPARSAGTRLGSRIKQ